MSEMQKFYELLFVATVGQRAYLRILKAFTKTNPEELLALTTDLVWQMW
jgi:hypothetical protein